MFFGKEAKKSFLRVFENKTTIERSINTADTFVLDYMKDSNNVLKDCCTISLDRRRMRWVFKDNFHKTEIKFNKMEYEEMMIKMYNKFPEMKNYYNFVRVGGTVENLGERA